MPCSHPIRTYTNARYLYHGVSLWKVQFNCNRCASCNNKNKREWRARAYYEALDTFRNPSHFILFDTLTYMDDNLRRYSDVLGIDVPEKFNRLAFSREDVKKFFKRLRINLTRLGFDHKGKLRYLLSSEFGTSEETKGVRNTHRPHYHILFYVNFDIDPLVLSRQISIAWNLGKTDGVKPYDDCNRCPVKSRCKGECIYQSEQYVLNERVFRSSTADAIKCSNYVTKYISKDMFAYPELYDNAYNYFLSLYPDFENDYQKVLEFRHLCRQVLPFHLQSDGFGLYALSSPDRDFILDTNSINYKVSDQQYIINIPLPRYFWRKLYSYAIKYDGKVYWFNNESYVDQCVKSIDKKIERLKNELSLWKPSLGIEKCEDIAIYSLVYRDSVCRVQDLYLPYKEFLRKKVSSSVPEWLGGTAVPMSYNFATQKDRLLYRKFIANKFSVTDDGEVVYPDAKKHKDWTPPQGYLVVNDNSCMFWYGFDNILKQFDDYCKDLGSRFDVIQSNKEAVVDTFKTLGLL